MGVAEVKEVLTHAANFFRLKKVSGKDEEYEKIPVSPPKELAEQILARQTQEPYLPFPALSAIVETPVIRLDGSILDQPGYDQATQLYYAPHSGMETCKVPLNPTPQERENALALLLSAFGEFPYVSDADKANALGLLLTPFYGLRLNGMSLLPSSMRQNKAQGKGCSVMWSRLSQLVTVLPFLRCRIVMRNCKSRSHRS